MKTNPPDHDATMALLGSIQETFSWAAFKPILNDPARLRAWLEAKMPAESEEEPFLDPEDPVVGERATLTADSEQKALELWGELDSKERELIEKAFLDLWGNEGAATLPLSLDASPDQP